MLDEEEHSTEDYGWLSPDGTFHEVESIDKIKKTTTYSVVDISEEDISSL
nr:MAG TPA: Sporulation inhibitor of replication protein SirA [Bacteriophage sp.]